MNSHREASERPQALQVQAWRAMAWRAMGGAGRVQLALNLARQVRRWKRDALRAQNVDWSELRVEQELARIYLRGNT